MQVVAVRISALDEARAGLPEFQKAMLAVHFMASRVIAPLVQCGAEEQEIAHRAAAELLGGTWDVHTTVEGLVDVCLCLAVPVVCCRGRGTCTPRVMRHVEAECCTWLSA